MRACSSNSPTPRQISPFKKSSANSRGKGIGMALLQRAIEWSHQQGYERLFVEHETANVYGGNFWRTHFTPYVYASMRYIDTTLDIPG
jgi:GNAT superfamily N-acetyltransferase